MLNSDANYAALLAAAKSMPQLSPAIPAQINYPQQTTPHYKLYETSEFGKIIRSLPELSSLSSSSINKFGGEPLLGQCALPHAILDRYQQGESLESVISEFENFAKSPFTDISWQVSLFGISLNEPIILDDGVHIVPVKQCSPEILDRYPKFSGYPLSKFSDPSVIVCGPTHSIKAIKDAKTEAGCDFSKLTKEGIEQSQIISEKLSLSAKKYVRSLHFSMHYSNKTARQLFPAWTFFLPGIYEFPKHIRDEVSPVLPGESISNFHLLENLEKSFAKRLIRASNCAVRAQTFVRQESYIDLGTALEILLSDSQNTEITYRIAVRCARFLYKDNDQMIDCYNLVKDLYKIRSKIVHGSEINLQASLPILQRGISLIFHIIEKLLHHGTQPKWDEDIVLG